MMSFLEAQNSNTGPHCGQKWKKHGENVTYVNIFQKGLSLSTKCYFESKSYNFTTVKIVVIRSENN